MLNYGRLELETENEYWDYGVGGEYVEVLKSAKLYLNREELSELMEAIVFSLSNITNEDTEEIIEFAEETKKDLSRTLEIIKKGYFYVDELEGFRNVKVEVIIE